MVSMPPTSSTIESIDWVVIEAFGRYITLLDADGETVYAVADRNGDPLDVLDLSVRARDGVIAAATREGELV